MSVDRIDEITSAFPELAEISDDTLKEQVSRAWQLGLVRGGWESMYDIPYAWNIHEVTTVEHVRGVTQIATSAANLTRSVHDAEPNLDVTIAAALLHDVGKCYEYVAYVDAELVDPDPTYADATIPHSLSSYALAHEVGCPIAVQQAIPHVIGEIPTRTLEAELVKQANAISSNAITQATMGISLTEWIDEYSTAIR